MSTFVAEAVAPEAGGNSDKRHSNRMLFDTHPNILRGMFTAAFALIAVVLFLIAPLYSTGDDTIGVSTGVNLFGIFSALASGGKYSFEAADIGEISVTMASGAGVMTVICFVLLLASVALGVLSMLGKLGSYEKAALMGVNFLSALMLLITFLASILPGMTAQDIWGNEREFYNVFSPGAGIFMALLCSVIAFGTSWGVNVKNAKLVRKNWLMYLFLVVPAILVVVYNIYPMILSVCMSMKDYVIADGVWGSAWVGFDNYVAIFTDADMLRIIGNTIFISVLRMVISIIPPIILAIMLYDMGAYKVRKGIQTIIYIPHFFSWVVVYAIAYSFINADGLFNNLTGDDVRILANEKAFIPLLLITDLWKECGWNTILYMAALTNVDPSLHEAAAIDGAGPLKRLWHITLPSIKPTVVFTTVMSVGNLLKGAGYEQIMLFGSDVMKNAQVIDTWVIWKGLEGLQYGLGAAVSFFQALIGLGMVVGCNYISKKWVGVGLY